MKYAESVSLRMMRAAGTSMAKPHHAHAMRLLGG